MIKFFLPLSLLSAFFCAVLQESAGRTEIFYSSLQLTIVFGLLMGMKRWVFSREIVLSSNPLFLIVYLNLCYFYLDSYSYFTEWRASQTHFSKFVGATVVAFVLLGAISILARNYTKLGHLSKVDFSRIVPPAILFVTILSEIVIVALLWRRGITAFNYIEGLSLEILRHAGWGVKFPVMMVGSLNAVNSFLAGMFITRRREQRSNLLQIVAVVTIVVTILISSSVIRSRSAMILGLIMVLLGFQVNHRKLGRKLIELSLWFVPLFIVLFGNIVLWITDREIQIATAGGLKGYVNRIGFVHFATFIANADMDWYLRLQVFWEGFLMAVPQLLLPDKLNMINDAYDMSLWVCRFPYIIDYTETLFSTGATLLGWAGIMVIPLLYFLFIGWLGIKALRLLLRRTALGLAFYLGVLCLSSIVEVAPYSIFSHLRSALIFSGILLIMFIPICRHRLQVVDGQLKSLQSNTSLEKPTKS